MKLEAWEYTHAPKLQVYEEIQTTTPEVTDRFQDGRRRHVGNSSACYKMGNYHPDFDENWYKTKKSMLSLEVTIPEVTIKFQDGRRRPFGN
jgi:hypothetical protein